MLCDRDAVDMPKCQLFFYKALVHTPPSLRRQRDYLVEFEDESEPSGRSEAQNVPQKYVLRIPDYAR